MSARLFAFALASALAVGCATIWHRGGTPAASSTTTTSRPSQNIVVTGSGYWGDPLAAAGTILEGEGVITSPAMDKVYAPFVITGQGFTDVVEFDVRTNFWRYAPLSPALPWQWTDLGSSAGCFAVDGWVSAFALPSRQTRARDILVYSQRTGDWCLGQYGVGGIPGLTWTLVGNTNNLGPLGPGTGHAFLRGRLKSDTAATTLCYYSGDGNWWDLDANSSLTVTGVGNTSGFGNLLDGRHWMGTGDFMGDAREEVIMYSSHDGDWWVGTLAGGNLRWVRFGSTPGFGVFGDGEHLVTPVQFRGSGPKQLLVHYARNGEWFLGSLDLVPAQQWAGIGDTRGPGGDVEFGNLLDGHHIVLTGDFDGDGRDEILMHHARDGNWWLGRLGNANRLVWQKIGNTRGPQVNFGDLLDGGHGVYAVALYQGSRTCVLMWYTLQHAFWLGTFDGTSLNWQLRGT